MECGSSLYSFALSNLSSKFKLFCVINGEQYGKVGKSPSKL